MIWNEQTCAYYSLANTLACSEKTYKTVVIGAQIWMAENLNYGGYLADLGSGELGRNQYQNGAEKFCYNNDTLNCESMGGLYQWHTALGFGQECSKDSVTCLNQIDLGNHQGICPYSWHLPTKEEWDTLLNGLGGQFVAGYSLKDSSFGGSNTSGFSVLGAGHREASGGFLLGESDANFWEARENEISASGIRKLYEGSDGYVVPVIAPKLFGFSVRCLKD